MVKNFKNFFPTVKKNVKVWELIYWWILRGLMIFALIYTIVVGHGPMGEYKGSNPWQQVAANLVGMFAYEIILLFFKEDSFFRNLSPRFQDITALGFFLGSFGGAFMNLYYSLPMYDKILHALGTAEAVYVGYEIICAMQIKLKKTCPFQIAVLCALGIGFIFSTGWELFEFSYDQFAGGDAQHWNVINALDEAGGDWRNVFLMFPVKDEATFMSRFPLMDTMADTVMNFAGGVIMYIILRIKPYRHTGANDINARIEAENAAEKENTAKAE